MSIAPVMIHQIVHWHPKLSIYQTELTDPLTSHLPSPTHIVLP